MFCYQKLNNHKNCIHERALTFVYQEYNLTFDELFAKDDGNLQKLLIEIFKFKMNLASEIMNELFYVVECPYLKNNLKFKSRKIRTARYRIEIATFASSRIWTYISSELKECTSLHEFRSKLKTWKPENCP